MKKLVTVLFCCLTYSGISQNVNFSLADSLDGWNTGGTILPDLYQFNSGRRFQMALNTMEIMMDRGDWYPEL